MTKEERLGHIARLEHVVRNFRIATSGDIDVLGGFGTLKQGETEHERLSNIEHATDKFNLVGDGVNVAGNPEVGYTIG